IEIGVSWRGSGRGERNEDSCIWAPISWTLDGSIAIVPFREGPKRRHRARFRPPARDRRDLLAWVGGRSGRGSTSGSDRTGSRLENGYQPRGGRKPIEHGG